MFLLTFLKKTIAYIYMHFFTILFLYRISKLNFLRDIFYDILLLFSLIHKYLSIKLEICVYLIVELKPCVFYFYYIPLYYMLQEKYKRK